MNLDKQISDILKFNKLCGHVVGDQAAIDLHVDMLNEEFNGQGEFRQSLRAGDAIGVRDGLADIFVVAVQLAHLGGVGAEGIVLKDRSLLSKELAHLGVVPNDGSLRSKEFLFENISADLHEIVSGNTFGEECSFVCRDMLRSVVRFAEACSIDLAADLDAVNLSNFSKFCKTESELRFSLIHWRKQRVSAVAKETGDKDYPFAIYALEGNKDYPQGKLLKPLGFQEPVFSEVA